MSQSDAVRIKAQDMSDDVKHEAIELTREALGDPECKTERDVASRIKKEFDRRYGSSWHCVVGRSFGSFVSHDSRSFLYFYIGDIAVLLFKSGS